MTRPKTRRPSSRKKNNPENDGLPRLGPVRTALTSPIPQFPSLPPATWTRAVVRRLLQWYALEARDLPWRRTSDPYAIWIAEIMLQQTQVQTVIPYWERWRQRFPTVQALAAARLSDVLKGWEGLGYYSRARNLHRAAGIIVARFQGRLPRRTADLLSLPGIGRYTAGAIGSIAYNQPVPVLDGNVIRVLTRLLASQRDPRQAAVNKRLWDLAQELVSQAGQVRIKGRRTCADLNQSLMELGAVVCSPRQPQCHACPLGRTCRARRQGRPEQYPVGKIRSPLLRRQWFSFVIENQGRYLVRQRPAQAINAGLWEFPTAEFSGSSAPTVEEAAQQALGFFLPGLQVAGTFRHNITRHQIIVRIYRAIAADPALFTGPGQWLEPGQLNQRPLAGAHKKIFQRLLAD